MTEITFASHRMILGHSGVLFWPERRTTIVADLHLEKGSYYAQFGQMLPQQESLETLAKLHKALKNAECETLILLGDSFHDEQGFIRMQEQSKALFQKLCSDYQIIWVIGNHDGAFVPANTQAVDEITLDNVTFRHEAVHGAQNEISGHYHPKASLKLHGSKVSRPCYILDENRMILPAFGTLTGGLDIRDEAISSFFETGFTAHLLGERKIYSIPHTKF